MKYKKYQSIPLLFFYALLIGIEFYRQNPLYGNLKGFVRSSIKALVEDPVGKNTLGRWVSQSKDCSFYLPVVHMIVNVNVNALYRVRNGPVCCCIE